MTITAPLRRTAPPSAPAPLRRRTLVAGITLPLAALSMMVSSDYKVRIRPLGQSLSASPDPNTIVEIAVYLAVFAILLRVLFVSRSWVSVASPLLYLTWVYSTYMFATIAWSIYPALAAVRGWQFLVSACLAATIARFGSRLDLHRLAHWYVAVVMGSVVFGKVFKFPRLRLMQHRFNWLYVHPVIAGTWLGLAVVITLWLMLTRKERQALTSWPRWLYALGLAMTVGGLIGTQTRGAIGGCVAGCSVLLLVRFRQRFLEVATFGVVSLFVVGLLFLGTITTYLARGESTSELDSFNGRTPLWDLAYHLVLRRPAVGYGTTASRGLFWDQVGLGGAHNAAINVIVDGGLIAVALWFAIIIGVFRLCRRLLETDAGRVDVPFIAAAMSFLLVNGMTTEGLGYVANVSSLWLYVLVGWLGVLSRRRRTSVSMSHPHAGAVGAATPTQLSRRQ